MLAQTLTHMQSLYQHMSSCSAQELCLMSECVCFAAVQIKVVNREHVKLQSTRAMPHV